MKKKVSISALVLIVFILLYIFIQETFWTIRESTDIDRNLTVVLAYDQEIFTFLDPAIEKEITVTNNQTGATLNFSLESIEWNLYFYVDIDSTNQTLRIADIFRCENQYDYSTLKPLNGQPDCFGSDNFCGGYSEKGILGLGKPTLVFDSNGFKR